MNSNVQPQSTTQVNLASLLQQVPYKNFLRPEQITAQQFPFLSEQELASFPSGVRTLWAAVASKPADDPQHQQALQKLQQLTQNVLRKYQAYKAQINQRRVENAQQQQLQLQQQQQDGPPNGGQGQQPPPPPPSAQATQQQAEPQQQQPGPSRAPVQAAPTQPVQAQSQPALASQNTVQPVSVPLIPQPMVVPNGLPKPGPFPRVPQTAANATGRTQDVAGGTAGQAPDGSPWEPPPALTGIEADQWKAEAQRRYIENSQKQIRARAEIIRLDQMAQEAKENGTELGAEDKAKRVVQEKAMMEARQVIESLMNMHRSHRAHAALLSRDNNDGTNGQSVQQATQQVQNPALQSGPQTAQGPPNPAVEAARQQQQAGRQASPSFSGQTPQGHAPSQMPQGPAMPTMQAPTLARPQPTPTQVQIPNVQHQSPSTMVPPGTTGSPAPLSQQAAIAASQRSYSSLTQPLPQSASAGTGNRPDLDKNNSRQWPMNKGWVPPPPQPVTMGSARPTLTGINNGPMGVMGQPAIQKQPPFLLQGNGDRVLDKKKLDELVRQVTGGSGESLHPEVEESVLQLADEFIDNVISSACKLAKLRGSASLEVKDIQLVLERQYNIRVPGFATDEIRTVRKIQPATGYLQKMNAVQAAKVMGGKTDI